MEFYRKKLNADIVLNTLCTILKCAGLWTPFDQKPWIIVLYKIYGAIFYIFFCVTLMISLTVGLSRAVGMRAISSLLPTTVAMIIMVPKLSPVYLMNRKIQKIRADIESFDLLSTVENHLVATKIRFFGNIVFAYGIFTQMAVGFYGVSSIIDQRVMYAAWLPGLNIGTYNRVYWLVEAYQYLGSVFTSTTSVAIDMYYCLAMYVASVELKLLGERFSSMQEIRSVLSSKQLLVDHVRTLRHIKSSVADIEYCVGLSYMPQVIMSAVSICSSTNELVKVRKKSYFHYFFSN